MAAHNSNCTICQSSICSYKFTFSFQNSKELKIFLRNAYKLIPTIFPFPCDCELTGFNCNRTIFLKHSDVKAKCRSISRMFSRHHRYGACTCLLPHEFVSLNLLNCIPFGSTFVAAQSSVACNAYKVTGVLFMTSFLLIFHSLQSRRIFSERSVKDTNAAILGYKGD